MHAYHSFRRILRAGLQSFGRNGLLTLATVLIMTSMLGSVLVILTASAVEREAVQEIERRFQLSLDVKEIASLQDVALLQETLKKNPNVVEVRYLSKEQVMEEFERVNGKVPEFLNRNPFPAKIRVLTKTLDARADIIQSIESASRFRDTVTLPELTLASGNFNEKVRNLQGLITNVERIGLALAFLFAIIAILVIVTTVRLTIHNRQDELAIQRLVGASNAFLIGPFLVEAMLVGLLASFLAILAFVPLVRLIFPNLDQYFAGFSIDQFVYSTRSMTFLLPLLGIGIHLVASFLSTQWYLRKQPAI